MMDRDVFLETDRLVLRRFTDSDADAALLFELDSDPEVMRYIGPFALPDVESYREQIRTRFLPFYCHPSRGCFGAFERATDEFLGWFFLRPAPAHRFAVEAGFTRESDQELGYRLRRAAWGRGFGTEGGAALLRIALDDPEVTCVVAMALITNRASWRIMEKLGMTRIREFGIPGYADPSVVYARCRQGCVPPPPVSADHPT